MLIVWVFYVCPTSFNTKKEELKKKEKKSMLLAVVADWLIDYSSHYIAYFWVHCRAVWNQNEILPVVNIEFEWFNLPHYISLCPFCMYERYQALMDPNFVGKKKRETDSRLFFIGKGKNICSIYIRIWVTK